MAVVLYDPLAIGSDNTFALSAGATKMIAMTRPDDDLTTYLTAPAADFARQGFTITGPPLGDVSLVQVGYRIKAPNGVTNSSFLRLGGVYVYGTTRTGNTAWQNWLQTIARPGGGSWAPADLATLQMGVRVVNDFGFAQQTTTVTAYITGTPLVGSYCFPDGTG